MRQRHFFWARHSLLCLAALTIAPALAATTKPDAQPTVDLRQSPTGGKTPVEVAVGLYITNIVSIDETRESFEVGGFITAQWKDPRLALPEGQEQTTPREFLKEQLWSPAIEGANTITHRTNQYTMEADRNGLVTYRERFESVYSNDFVLKKFPFDTQVLRFEFQPFLTSSSQIRFAPQALPGTGISPNQHTELAAWRLLDLRYTTEKVTGDPFLPDTQESLFQIRVARNSGFYVWKVFCH
jgi:hypothetical protein